MKLRVALLLFVFLISQNLPSVQSWMSVSATTHSHSHQKQFDQVSTASLHATCMEIALEEEAEDEERKLSVSFFEWFHLGFHSVDVLSVPMRPQRLNNTPSLTVPITCIALV